MAQVTGTQKMNTILTQNAFKGNATILQKGRVVPCKGTERGMMQVRNAVKEVFMPALSSTMTEGKIVSWLKSPGDKVVKGESIVVVESDKADMDVESFNEGFLGAIVINEGGVANVGDPIAYIAETEAEINDAKAKAGGASNGATATAPAPAPAVEVKAPEPVAVASASSSSPPPPPPPPAPVAAPSAPIFVPQPRSDGRVIATPYAKKLARELGLDLAAIIGSGPAGRITASDVEAAKSGKTLVVPPPPPPSAAAPPAAPPAAATPPTAAAPTPSAATKVSELKGTTQPFTGMQMAVSKNMLESLKVPEFRLSYTIKTDKLDDLYKKLKPKGVTMSGLLAKACGLALAKHPVINAVCTPDGSGITYNENINVAMAVAMPDGGLITPVIKNADSTDIYTMSRTWADLVKRARGKQLAPDEYNSGTFFISNLGMFGVDTFDAILPPNSGAIIAIGSSKSVVTVDGNGRIGVEKQMMVNLTCDHRIIYGADAAEFLGTLAAVIENPDQLVF